MTIHVAIYPSARSNEYLRLMSSAIARAGGVAEDFSPLRHPCRFMRSRVCLLNWFESTYPDSGPLARLGHIVKRHLYLSLMLATRRRVVTVVHNRRPHSDRFPRLHRGLFKRLLRRSDYIVTLCDQGDEVAVAVAGERVRGRLRRVAHPAYDVEGEAAPDRPFKVVQPGSIQPYKGVHLLIEVARRMPGVEFVVAGAVDDAPYYAKIERMAAALPNVELRPGFMSEEALRRLLLDEATLVALPYALTSSLNSGMAMMALSAGVNVAMPPISPVTLLRSRPLAFTYLPASSISSVREDAPAADKDDAEPLFRAIAAARDLYLQSPAEYAARAAALRREVRERFSLDRIASQIKPLL